MFTSISASITSTLGTLQHHNRFIEGSLLAKHAEKYVININKFRSARIVSALLCLCPIISKSSNGKCQVKILSGSWFFLTKNFRTAFGCGAMCERRTRGVRIDFKELATVHIPRLVFCW